MKEEDKNKNQYKSNRWVQRNWYSQLWLRQGNEVVCVQMMVDEGEEKDAAVCCFKYEGRGERMMRQCMCVR